MSDQSPAEDVAQAQSQSLPWWVYVTLGFFALGILAALLGVRTCI